MRLLFVRHGEMDFGDDQRTDLDTLNRLWNLERQAGLSARGRGEAAAVAALLTGSQLDAIYASHLLRARETAAATAETKGLPVQVTEDLTELRPGHLPVTSAGGRLVRAVNALPWLEPSTRIAILAPALIPFYFLTWLRGRTWGGEARIGLDGRIDRILAHLCASHPADSQVALFAHGYIIFYLAGWRTRPGRARLSAFRRPYVANGSITEFELGPTSPPELIRFADTAHLAR